VEGCAECAAELARWRRLADGIERLPSPPLPDSTLARLAARAEAHQRELEEQRWNRLVLAGLVAYGWALFLVSWPFLPLALDWLSARLVLPPVGVVIAGVIVWWSFCWVIGLALLPLLQRQKVELEERVQ